jgi:Tfp pilus assembly protein PilE
VIPIELMVVVVIIAMLLRATPRPTAPEVSGCRRALAP